MKTLFTKESLPAAFGILVIIVTGTLLFTMQKSPAGAPVTGMPMSLNELLSSTAEQRCAFVTPSEVGVSSGELFIAHGSMRGDFEVENVQGEVKVAVKSHMLIHEGYAYVWTDTAPMGAKISTEAMKAAEEKGNSDGGPIALNKKVSYNCSPWSHDESYFEIPKEITFMDMTSLSTGGIPTGTGAQPVAPTGVGGEGSMTPAQIKAFQCKTCEQTGAQVAECKKAFACTE